MALYNKVYVINYRDKPFGAVFPLDVQNRILCMSWYADHRDRYAKVMAELQTLPICRLTDWCARSTYLFQPTLLDVLPDQLARQAQPSCAWRRIYVVHNESIELRILEVMLQRRRDDLAPTSNSYDNFVRENAQWYADVQLFTLTHVLVPMLTWLPPHLVALHHQEAPPHLSFAEIQNAHLLLWESFKMALGKQQSTCVIRRSSEPAAYKRKPLFEPARAGEPRRLNTEHYLLCFIL